MSYTLTKEKLKKCLPFNKETDEWFELLEKHLKNSDIKNNEQLAMFIAQCSHESNNFNTLSENLNYSSVGLLATFPKYFNRETANLFHRKPEKIANKVYANRMGNGTELSGDGWKYRGAGLIQTTGKNNHSLFAEHVKKPLDEASAYLRTKEGALLGALFYWKTNKLALLKGNVDKVSDMINRGRMTEVIGDAIGYADRKAKYEKILKILQE